MRESAPEDVVWQVGPTLPAERTLGNDPRIGHRLYRSRNALGTTFAPNDEIA
jgi:hypothetical protein